MKGNRKSLGGLIESDDRFFFFFFFCLRNTEVPGREERGSRAIRSDTFIPRITRELETCERVPIQRTK